MHIFLHYSCPWFSLYLPCSMFCVLIFAMGLQSRLSERNCENVPISSSQTSHYPWFPLPEVTISKPSSVSKRAWFWRCSHSSLSKGPQPILSHSSCSSERIKSKAQSVIPDRYWWSLSMRVFSTRIKENTTWTPMSFTVAHLPQAFDSIQVFLSTAAHTNDQQIIIYHYYMILT